MTGSALSQTHKEKHEHQLQVKKGALRLERHSGAGVYGSPKKEGFAGWGRPGEEYEDPVVALDPNDPNYDEDEAQPQKPKDRQNHGHAKEGEKAAQEKGK